MRINKLTLMNFRAFPEPTSVHVEFKGKAIKEATKEKQATPSQEEA